MRLKRIIHGLIRKFIEKRLEYYKVHNQKKYADCLYYNTFGYYINWKAPRDLNEWINWLAFNTDTAEWSRLADKYSVRDFVSEKGLADILIPFYGVWDDPNDIDFDKLPQSFVLKCNNGSGDIMIVHDKNKIDKSEVISIFNKSLKSRFGLNSAEPHYLKISPKIVAEALLEKNEQEIFSSSLVDYKFWCFNGEIALCWVAWDRDNVNHKVNVQIYDKEWNLKPELCYSSESFFYRDVALPKPSKWEEMLAIARKLSTGFPQVRVDLYLVGGKIYFGEMTFTSQCGRMPYFSNEAQLLLGNYCKKSVSELGLK